MQEKAERQTPSRLHEASYLMISPVLGARSIAFDGIDMH
jgi:hypothetical protein